LASVEPNVQVAVDAVQGSNPNAWTAAQAIETGRALESLGLLWYEEPCSALDLQGYRACREALDVPIAGGETLTTVQQFQSFLAADPVDVLQPDAAYCGGILPLREVAALCELRDVAVAVHAWGSGGSIMSNYHAAFASPAARWLEWPTQTNPLIAELIAEPIVVSDGYVSAPTAPGLGLSLTPELEERFPYRPDCHYYFEERRAGASLARVDV
jgi:D-arabinonate dehydratase/D-galactarolactone cycloisomerase